MSLHRWGHREEGHMLEPEDFMVIQALVKRGVYLCDITGQLGVHPRTVRRALQRGEAPARRGGRRGSLLDPVMR
jgi:IS30 family transposase